MIGYSFFSFNCYNICKTNYKVLINVCVKSTYMVQTHACIVQLVPDRTSIRMRMVGPYEYIPSLSNCDQ